MSSERSSERPQGSPDPQRPPGLRRPQRPPGPRRPQRPASPSVSPQREGTPLSSPMDQSTPDEAIAPPAKPRSSTRPRRPAAPPAAIKPAPSLDLNSLWEKVRPILLRLQTAWGLALPRLRSVLPASFNQKLSDRALTGLVAGLLVLLLWLTTSLFSGKSPEVAQAPSLPGSPPVDVTTPSAPTPAPPAQPAPPPQPALELTPEQSLIAAIQDQVAEVTNRYANGLIQTVEANFRSSRLMVKVSPGWYDLPSDRQDQLANEMLKRSKELDFGKLEITAPDGLLLARSPVVGDNMVILRRAGTDLNLTALQPFAKQTQS